MDDQDGQVDPSIAAELQYLRKRMDDLMRFQLDPRNELADYKMHLLGQRYDPNTGEVINDPDKMQFMNERGANAVIGDILPRASKIGAGSNVTKEEILKRCLNNNIALAFFLFENEAKFNIESNSTKTVVLNQIDDIQLFSMLKSKDGWLADSLNKNISYVESKEHIQNLEKQKNIPFDPFRSRRGGE